MSYAVDELTWPKVGRILAEDPRLIMTIGALEQHGPHLPIGTNIFIAEQVARTVSERCGILRAPPFSYGVTVSGGPFRAPGLRRKTLHRAVNELIGGWEDLYVQHFHLITAHRYEPHLEALLMTASGPAHKSVYDLYQIDVSDVIETDPEFEHAGELETSLMLYLAPDRVKMDRAADFRPQGFALRKYTRRRVPKPPVESRGVLGSPRLATREKGAAVFDRYVAVLCTAVDAGMPDELAG
jgi:creatinine amidohydrolase